jgi:hypothetical protein
MNSDANVIGGIDVIAVTGAQRHAQGCRGLGEQWNSGWRYGLILPGVLDLLRNSRFTAPQLTLTRRIAPNPIWAALSVECYIFPILLCSNASQCPRYYR